MDGSTPTICNYCEGQAFEKGRCLGCGASSWKILNAIKWILPQQHATNDHGFSVTEPEVSGVFALIKLIKSAIHLVEKLVSMVMTLIKFKLLLIFSFLVLAAITGSITSKPGGQKNDRTVSEFQPQNTNRQPVEVIGTWSEKRFKPIPMQAPTPRVFIDEDRDLSSFPLVKATWGKHFNPTKLVPANGFLAFYFDSSNPTQLVHPVQVSDINIDYSYSDFRGIPSQNFGAYWVGVISTLKTETIEVIADDGWNEFRVIIDGSIVQEHSRESGPALVQSAKVRQAHRAPGEGVIILQEAKAYPKSRAGNPLVTLAPGDHLVEIEMLNNWHTTDFSAQFKRAQSD